MIERKPITIACEVCKKTITIERPRSFEEWSQTAEFKAHIQASREAHAQTVAAAKKRGRRKKLSAQELETLMDEERPDWHMLSAGRFGRDVLVCGKRRCQMVARETLTPPEMIADNPKWRIGDYVSSFIPGHDTPAAILRQGGWPPPESVKGKRKIRNPYVYLAGPLLGAGEPASQNIAAAIHDAQRIADAGYVPFIPHLYFFADMVAPRPLDHWYRLDRAWLEKCGALVRRPGSSAGADLEEGWAEDLRIPVWHGVDAFLSEMPEPREKLSKLWPGDVRDVP